MSGLKDLRDYETEIWLKGWLFTGAGAFNRDISNWDTSKVTN